MSRQPDPHLMAASDEQIRQWLALAVHRKEHQRVSAIKFAMVRRRLLRDRAAKFESLRRATAVRGKVGLAELAKRCGDTAVFVKGDGGGND